MNNPFKFIFIKDHKEKINYGKYNIIMWLKYQ